MILYTYGYNTMKYAHIFFFFCRFASLHADVLKNKIVPNIERARGNRPGGMGGRLRGNNLSF